MDNNTTNNTTQALQASDGVIYDLLLASYIITMILGSVGNTLVLIVVVGKRARRTVNDIFIMNLAVSDLLFICFLPLFIYENLAERMVEKSIGLCKFITPTITATFLLSIFTLTSMSVHRCQVIVNPFKRDLSQKKSAIWIAVIWLLSFIVILPLIIVNIVNPVETTLCFEDWPSEQYQKGYTVTLFVIQYVVPLFVIAVSYIRIGLDLNRSSSSDGTLKLPNSAICRARRSENLQVIKTLATIVTLFALFMLPGQIAWLILDFGAAGHKEVALKMRKYTLPVTIFHSCLNPLVYGTVTRQFRRDYMRYLSHLLCCCPEFKYKAITRFGSPRITEASPQHSRQNKENDSQFGGSSERFGNGASVPLFTTLTTLNGSDSPSKTENNNSANLLSPL